MWNSNDNLNDLQYDHIVIMQNWLKEWESNFFLSKTQSEINRSCKNIYNQSNIKTKHSIPGKNATKKLKVYDYKDLGEQTNNLCKEKF